jgi:ketosteroid isomerase-like protein
VEPEELVSKALDALHRGDADGFGACLGPDVELHTRRGTLRSREALKVWAATPRYEHLDVEARCHTVEAVGDRVIAHQTVRLRWRDGGEIADEYEQRLELRIRDGLIRELRRGEPG